MDKNRGYQNKQRNKNILEKIFLFCILFASFKLVFEDFKATFCCAVLGDFMLTGWASRWGYPDRELSSLEADESSLYVHGMMRNTRKYFSKIKACFIFQTLLLADTVLAAVYSLWKYIIYSVGNSLIEEILSSGYIIILIGYICSLSYSVGVHNRGYKYVQNRNGIWMPFSYICGKYEKLINIERSFPEAEERHNFMFAAELLQNDYQKESEYELNGKGKICFYKKNKQQQINIWALIEIEDMDNEDIQMLNDKFADFWINDLTREEKKKDVRFTFVIQVDEMNDFLKDLFYGSAGVYMDKHRSRMPVLCERKHDILKIKWPDYNSKYKNIHKEMREELKQMYNDMN